MRDLILILGPMRSGKTTFCRELYRLLADKSPPPFAVIEENIRDSEGFPVSLALRDISAGEEIPLARREERPSGGRGGRAPFAFSEEAFPWAESRIKKAVAEGCGILMIDEIGPLEAAEGGGFLEIVEWALANGDCPLLLTLRPELEGLLLERLSSSSALPRVDRLRLDAGDLDRTLRFASEAIFRHCQERKGTL